MYEKQDPSLPYIDYYQYGDDVKDLWILASGDYSPVSRALDAETRVYLLHKFIELADDDFLKNIMKEYPDSETDRHRTKRMKDYILEARKRLIAEELALGVATRYPTRKFLENWQQDSLRKLDVSSNTYALSHEYLGKYYLTFRFHPTARPFLDSINCQG